MRAGQRVDAGSKLLPPGLKTLTRNTVCGLGSSSLIRDSESCVTRATCAAQHLKRDLELRRCLSTQRKKFILAPPPPPRWRSKVGFQSKQCGPSTFFSFHFFSFIFSLSFFPFSIPVERLERKKVRSPNSNCVATCKAAVKVRRRGRGRVEKWRNVIGCRVWQPFENQICFTIFFERVIVRGRRRSRACSI